VLHRGKRAFSLALHPDKVNASSCVFAPAAVPPVPNWEGRWGREQLQVQVLAAYTWLFAVLNK
jgi:hypothetical protein